ncbi:hypothetical protein [Georgenia halophila]
MQTNPCDPADYTNVEIGPEVVEVTPEEPAEPEDQAEPEPESEPIIVTAEELATLPIDPGGLTVQPDRGWVLVNKETVVYTGAGEQTFNITLLGTPVEVHVVPIDYTWDFGDGTETTTTEPGAPWPNHTVWHTYTDADVTRTITLTTRWVGEFEVADSGVWLPVNGVATTTTSSDPFEVREFDTQLTTSAE